MITKKIMIKIATILVFCFSFFTIAQRSAYAVEVGNNDITTQIPTLKKAGESYSSNFKTATGEVGTITVTKVADGEPEITSRWIFWNIQPNVTNGTYHINVVLGVTNAGFTITVNNKKITSAYDPWYAHISGSSATLTLDSDTKATYNINFNLAIPLIGGPSWSGGVQARIENGALVTYFR